MKSTITQELADQADTAGRLVCDGTMDVPAACLFTGLGRTFLYSLMDCGKLRFAKLGKRRLIPKAELVRLLAEGLVRSER